MKDVGKIRRLEITGGFLGNFAVDLSDGLNCVIGSRGTGKTTALEAIRFVLSKKPIPETVDKLLRHNLAGAAVKVTLEYESSPGNFYTVAKFLDEEPTFIDPKGQEIEFPIDFPISVYSTDEIEKVADDVDGILKRDLIDGFTLEEIRKLRHFLELKLGEVSKNTNEILVLENRSQQLQEATISYDIKQKKFDELVAMTEDASTEDFKTEQQLHSIRSKEAQRIENVLTLLSQLATELASVSNAAKERNQATAKQKLLKAQNTSIAEQVERIASETMKATINQIAGAIKLLSEGVNNLETLKIQLARLHQTQKQKYDELRQQNAAVTAKIKDREELQADLEELNKKITELGEINKRLSELKIERAGLLEEKISLQTQMTLERQKVAEYVTKSSIRKIKNSERADILVEVIPQGDKLDFKGFLQMALQGSKLKYSQLLETLAANSTPIEFVNLVKNENYKKIAEIAGIDELRARTLVQHMRSQPQYLYTLEAVVLDDKVEIRLNVADDESPAEYRESARLSTGQKCTAILPLILLSTSTGPLLIDQPENNLDNQYIFKDIIPRLEAIKKTRQLLFITHNPNIPVLADAERVVVLSASSQDGTVRGMLAKAGTVMEVRDDIISLLEGGKEAFEMRSQKYSQVLPILGVVK